MNGFKNLAGREDADLYIENELKIANIPFEPQTWTVHNGEVKSKIFVFFNGWNFIRAWRYWIVKTEENPLFFKYADVLHKELGKEVRVSGHCNCPSPREWYRNPWNIGVNCYHIDTQLGLNKFVEFLNKQVEENVNKKMVIKT